MKGGLKSPAVEAAATNSDSTGPKRTAVKTIATSETDASRFSPRRALHRSETAATIASAATAHGLEAVPCTDAQSPRRATAAPESAAARLRQVKGLGVTSVSVLLDEGLVWRDFKNRRQLGGLLGFAPIKYESGEISRDQGISRAGNDRLQSTMVQLAWGWVQWQPQSALTQWYLARFGIGKRTRKVGIVALARKLFIALWRYATAGIVPTGAILRPA